MKRPEMHTAAVCKAFDLDRLGRPIGLLGFSALSTSDPQLLPLFCTASGENPKFESYIKDLAQFLESVEIPDLRHS